MDAGPEQGETAIVRTSGPSHGRARPPEPWWEADPDGATRGIPRQRRVLLREMATPDSVAGWKALVEGLLTNHCCAFHRNMEISARYAGMYELQPAAFKWAAMAALASHHVRLALFPLRLDTDGTGFVDIPRSLGRRRVLLTKDVDTIRMTNNAIFDDIFWVHLAYATADDGLDRLRPLLRTEPRYRPVLAAFEAIDEGRRVLEDPAAPEESRRAADSLVWAATLQILEHEQRSLVQPHFDHLSCAFARLVSLAATTSFEVRGVRQEVAYFTSFYLTSLTLGARHAARAWPRITRFEDRWRWLQASVVPRFRRLEAEMLVAASMRRIADEARVYAAMPCVVPGQSIR